MVEPANTDLSIGKQCRLLSISRSSFYYRPKGETAMNLMLMRQIDEQFLETPFFGVRQMTWHLRNEGHWNPRTNTGIWAENCASSSPGRWSRTRCNVTRNSRNAFRFEAQSNRSANSLIHSWVSCTLWSITSNPCVVIVLSFLGLIRPHSARHQGPRPS